MYQAIKFTELIPGTVTMDNYGNIRIRTYGEITKDIKGKVAYLPLTNNVKKPRELIGGKDSSGSCWPKTGKTLYVCKDSHVPRALLRNAEYKITINRDNADFVVIPAPREEDVSTRMFNIIYTIQGPKHLALYYFTLNYPWGHDEDKANLEDVEPIKEEIKKRIPADEDESFQFFGTDELNLQTMYFLKDIQEYEDILTDAIRNPETDRDKYSIVLDTELNIDSTSEITPEMLQIWSKMDGDRHILAKHIIGSNWQKYPCTVSVIIDDMNMCFYGGEQMRYVTRSIDFDYYRYNKTFRHDRLIQPEDWNMLQDWIMLKTGMKPEGGFKIQRGSGIGKFVHYAECVKPCRISEPTLFQEIEARLKI